MIQKRATVGIISLGCPKALVDTEQMVSRLKAEGYQIAENDEQSDLTIINTCGFIEEAIEESCDAIFETLQKTPKVIVTGCLFKKADFLRKRFDSLLDITPPANVDALMQALHRHLPAPHAPDFASIPKQGIRLTPPHFAYLKIAEGCSHRCRFCIIPQLRGPLVSRSVSEIMREAEALFESGTQEILVVSQDTAAFGSDLKQKTGFWGTEPVGNNIVDLADALGDLGIWIRLHYLYPYAQLDRLVEKMSDGKILPYLDMPLQHASRDILRSMRRPAATENMLARIENWRSICPDLTLRSTFIVGYPGETEEDFERLLDFLEAAKLDRVGCFAYSAVEGAEANALPDPVDPHVAETRRMRLMAVQNRISSDNMKKWVGKKTEVLIDEVDGDTAIGRTQGDAPDIDGLVYIANGAAFSPGDLVEVTIDRVDDHDYHVDAKSPQG